MEPGRQRRQHQGKVAGFVLRRDDHAHRRLVTRRRTRPKWTPNDVKAAITRSLSCRGPPLLRVLPRVHDAHLLPPPAQYDRPACPAASRCPTPPTPTGCRQRLHPLCNTLQPFVSCQCSLGCPHRNPPRTPCRSPSAELRWLKRSHEKSLTPKFACASPIVGRSTSVDTAPGCSFPPAEYIAWDTSYGA